MKTLYITDGANIVVDNESNQANKMKSEYTNISRVYLADEDMHIVYGCGEKHEEKDCKKGDIIVVFYYNKFDTTVAVVTNEDWANNLIARRKREEEEALRWAEGKTKCPCDECECKCCDSQG